MSLLYNEPPIAVSPTLAKELGLNAAVFLQQLHYWIEQKKQHGSRYQDSYKDGYFWVYNTVSEWLEQLPFLGSKSTFKRMIYDLQEKGVLVIGNYNKFDNDHTSWYRINYLRLEQISKNSQVQNEPPGGSKRDAGEFKMERPAVQNEPSITRDYTETTTEILNTPFNPPTGETSDLVKADPVYVRSEDFREAAGQVIENYSDAFKALAQTTDPKTPTPSSAPPPSPPGFDEFWQQYPAKVAKPAALKAWRKLKPGQDLQATIQHDIAKRKASDPKWEQGFIPNPATYLNQARWEDQPVKVERDLVALPVRKGFDAESKRRSQDLLLQMMAECEA